MRLKIRACRLFAFAFVTLLTCRYRKWQLDSETSLIARCELDAVTDAKGQDQYLSIKALNEFDPKVVPSPLSRCCS